MKGVYFYRCKCVTSNPIGWDVENCLDIFKTLNDAKQYINKYLDGTNTKEPRIVGKISLDENDNIKYVTIK